MRHLLLLFTLSCLACRGSDSSGESSTTGKCDTSALVELSEALARAPEHQRLVEVLPGLTAACGDAFPAAASAYFQAPAEVAATTATRDDLDPQLEALTVAACPDWATAALVLADAPADQRATAVYRACSFNRFDVLAEHELRGTSAMIISWALHQWLLDQGLAPAQAKPITLALMSLERQVTAPVKPMTGQTLPTAPGLPIPDGMVLYLTRDAITFEGRTLLALDSFAPPPQHMVGAANIIGPVYDTLEPVAHDDRRAHESRGEKWRNALIVAADAQTPFSTLLAVFNTADRLGFEELGLAVDSRTDGVARVPFALPTGQADRRPGVYRLRGPAAAIPQMADDNDPDMPGVALLSVEIAADNTMTVSRGADHQQPPEPIDRGDHAAIGELAEAVKRDDPRARRVVISAAPTVPLQTIVAVAAANRGPKCDLAELDCVLPEILLVPEHAHDYDSRGRRPATVDWQVGDAENEVIGLGNTGLIGKGGRLDKPKSPPRITLLEPTVDGALDTDIIRRIVQARISELRSCYSRGLTDNPELAGEVILEFVIAAKGKVSVSTVETTSLADTGVANCMAKSVKGWTFPKPRGGGDVKVEFPFDLAPP